MEGAQVSNGDLLKFRRYLTCKLWSDLELCWFIWSRFGMLTNSCGNNTMIGSFDGYLEAAADMKRTSMNLQIWYWQQLAFVWYSFWNVGKQKTNARIRMSFMVPSYAIRGVTHTATHLSKQKKAYFDLHPSAPTFPGRKVGITTSSRSSPEHSSLNQAARDPNASCCRALEDRPYPPWSEWREAYEVIRREVGQWCSWIDL